MFSKSTFLALFTLAVTTFSANAAPLGQQFETETFCNTATIAISTVVSTVHETHTVTVSSRATGTASPGDANNAIADTTTTALTSTSTAKSSSGSKGSSGSKSSSSSSKSSGKGSSKGSSGSTGSTTTSSATASTSSTAVLAVGGGSGNAQDLQTSTTLDPNVIQTTGTGQNPPVAGQSDAATSVNNFINFCSLGLPNVPITNGLQLTDGSCNPIPIGNIPSTANIPSSKFQNPTNGATLKANTAFNVTLGVKNIQLGTFTAATETYYANPQTLNAQGQIIGHTHIVIESIASLDTTEISDPLKFAFFKGVDGGQDGNGNVVVPVTAGLPAGTYRMGTIMSSATHQPVIVAVAQHGLVDDAIYMTVTEDGAPAAAAAGAGAAAAGAGAGAAATAGKGGNAAVAVSSSAAAAASGTAVVSVAPASAAAATATGKAAKGKGGSKNISAVASSAAVETSAVASVAPASAAPATGKAAKGKGGSVVSSAAVAAASSAAVVDASSSAAPAAASAAAAGAAGAAAGASSGAFTEAPASAGKAVAKGKALS